MDKGAVIRRCQPFELGKVLSLLSEAGLHWETGDTEEHLTRKLERDHESIQVVELERNIIGVVMFIYDPWASFVWHLAVRSKYRGQGHGKALLERAEAILRSRGTSSINGYVYPDNERSRIFFKKHGYTEVPPLVMPISKFP